MDEEILKRIAAQDLKIEEMERSVKTIKRYFLWTGIITIALIVLPIIGLLFAIPKLLSVYNSALNF